MKEELIDSTNGLYYKVPVSEQRDFEQSLLSTELLQPRCCVYKNEETILAGWYDKPLRYCGRDPINPKLAIFFLGIAGSDIFNPDGFAYYDVLLWLATTHFFKIYGHGSGRDFIYKNGKWK